MSPTPITFPSHFANLSSQLDIIISVIQGSQWLFIFPCAYFFFFFLITVAMFNVCLLSIFSFLLPIVVYASEVHLDSVLKSCIFSVSSFISV